MGTNADAAQPPSRLTRVLIGRNPKRTLVRIVILVVVCFLVRAFVLVPIQVDGPSMLLNYKDRSLNLVNRLAYLLHEPRRGDVVAIRSEAGEHLMYLKRIVGLPGETVAFHHGRVFIKGKMGNFWILAEPYVKLPGNWEHEPEPVGPDQYYVVGDNRDMPWDDHYKGRPARNLIVGKVLL